MNLLKVDSEFFNAKDTLLCGQFFRYVLDIDGAYTVYSLNKRCKVYTIENFTYLESDDIDYFTEFFDLKNDYSKIYNDVLNFNDPFISHVATLSKGIRILKQNVIETALYFIISQNNNIKRIQNSVEKLCQGLGEKIECDGGSYYAFPTVKNLASASLDFYKSIGLGYRAEYIKGFAEMLNGGYNLDNLRALSTSEITSELLKIKGIGKKVADCITLFGFNRTDSFPVDTWIEKIYIQNLNGKQKDRVKISQELLNKFGNLSGYVQQYVFYYKRSLENK